MRTKLVVAFWLALSLGPALASQLPTEAAKEFQTAVRDLQTGHYDEALETLTELDRRIPNNAEILHLSAILLDLTGHPEEAGRFFERAARSNPKSAVIRTNLAVNLMRRGKSRMAEQEFREALKLDPGTAAAAFNLGTLLMARQQLPEAERWLKKAFQLQPGVYENGYQLAFCSFLLGNHAQVEQVLSALGGEGAGHPEFTLLQALNERAQGRPSGLTQALATLVPLLAGEPETARQVATLLQSQGLDRESIPVLTQLTRDQPTEPSNWLRLGRAALVSGDGERAREAAERALELGAGAEAHALLGDSYERLEKPLKAVEHFQRAVALEPSEEYLYDLGYEFLIHWNWDAASQVFGRGLEMHPNSWRMLIGAGAAQLGRDDPEKATQAFIKAVDADPEQPLGYRLLAQSFARSEASFPAAVERFSRLHERLPDDPWAVYFWTLALFEKASRPGAAVGAELVEALTKLASVAKSHSDIFEFESLLGEGYFLTQSWEAAERSLREATRINPDDVQTRYKLGLTLRRLGKTEEARTQLQAYQQLKAKQDLAVNKRMSETTKFIIDLKAQ